MITPGSREMSRPLISKGVFEKGRGMDEAEIVEQVVRAGREYRDDMARWLALEVLLNDEVAGQDEALAERLLALQERVEEGLRAKLGAGRPSSGELAGHWELQGGGRE
jgi:hypothetical protein